MLAAISEHARWQQVSVGQGLLKLPDMKSDKSSSEATMTMGDKDACAHSLCLTMPETCCIHEYDWVHPTSSRQCGEKTKSIRTCG